VSRRLHLALVGLLVFALVAGAVAACVAPARAASALPQISSPSAVILDAQTGRVLYSKDAHRHRQMASLTKIMTALLAIQHLDTDKSLRVPSAIHGWMGVTLGLSPGQHISTYSALQALLLQSANDAGVTLAYSVAGNQVKFVKLMNAAAAAWGLNDTHYDNCVGYQADPRHHTSAYDLAFLARRAMQEPRFRDIVGTRIAVISWNGDHSRLIRNSDTLLQYAWADGVKPGVTHSAGYCLVGSGQPGLRSLITVSMHAATREACTADQLALFEYGSSLYETRDLADPGEIMGEVTATDGSVVRVAAEGGVSAVVRSAATVSRSLVVFPALAVAPPAGAVVGSVVFRADGIQLGSTGLVVAP
jgi:D-alanyl-D-alanine carboxypeptidase (penicillin-binding protein 5/6)